jgi:hypothetical protein
MKIHWVCFPAGFYLKPWRAPNCKHIWFWGFWTFDFRPKNFIPSPQDWTDEKVAQLLFKLGFPYGVSTGIHDGETRGYGELDANGFWQFELTKFKPRW